MPAILTICRAGSPDCEAFLERLAARGAGRLEEAEAAARDILREVESDGDAALRRLTERYDGVRPADLRVPPERLRALAGRTPEGVRRALREAASRVRRFHEAQRRAIVDFSVEIEGIVAGQRTLPIDRAGVYVPGGSAAYPSTVLMNVIPARVAGVREIAAATPPGSLESAPAVAAALEMLEVREVYAVGGAQAIAALAVGTESVRPVDKIVGPGNVYVNAAKRLVAGRVGADSFSGPSEVLVIADAGARAKWVAADLAAQAEHDPDSAAVALVPSHDLARQVQAEAGKLASSLPRGAVIRASLERFGATIVCESDEVARALAERIAPEHLALHVREPRRWMEALRHAGSVFLGEHAAGVLGDYGCGPNHVLPTARACRFDSALGVASFLRITQWVEATPGAAQRASGMVETLAEAEGLGAHAHAMRVRREEAR